MRPRPVLLRTSPDKEAENMAQPGFAFTPDVTVPVADAARRLCISRARLAELVLTQELELVGPQNLAEGRVRLSDVDRLGDRLLPAGGIRKSTRPPAGMLPRIQHTALQLLADWGSSSRLALQVALHQHHPAFTKSLGQLEERGLVHREGSTLMLSERGRDYLEAYPKVS